MLASSKQTAGSKTKSSAQAHLIYTTNDILELFGIVPNTLTAWKKLGLPFVRSTSDLYLGQDLSGFQKWNKHRRRIPLEKTEVYCVHCKQKHSLHDNAYSLRHSEAGSDHLAVICPISGKEAHRFVSANELKLIEKELNPKNRTDRDDYNVVRAGSKIAISSSPGSAIKNHDNLILRYEYQTYLKQVEGFSIKTIIAILRHIAQFDTHNQHRDYRTVHRENVISYKSRLEERLSAPDKKQLSASTIVHSLIDLKKFFQWLELKTMVRFTNAGLGEYFSPSRELSALAAASTADLFIPTIEQLRKLILSMPSDSLIQRRDRTILAVLTLTGARISALLSLRIQHVNIETQSIFQDARFVQTKNTKTMRTKWFPVGEDIENILIDWVTENLNNGANPTDPLFLRAMDPIRLLSQPAYSGPLRDQGTVREIIKCACKNIGIKKFKPHAVRSTLARFGNELCRSQKQLKAWSQNLGHENIKTTDSCYAKLDVSDQFAVLDKLRTTNSSVEMQNLMHILPSLTPDKLRILSQVAQNFNEY